MTRRLRRPPRAELSVPAGDRGRGRPLAAALLALAGWLGCGGSTSSSPSAHREPPAAAPAPAPAAPAARPSDAPVGEAECNQLADHLVDLSMAEPQKSRAESYTTEDAEAAKRELRTSLAPACAQLSRQALTCALAARSSAELAACK